MEYGGIDLHKRYTRVARVDEEGKVLCEQRVPVERAAVRRFVRSLPSAAKLTGEATQNWIAFSEWSEDRFPDLTLCHPLKAKASARIRTDTRDPRPLAHLLRTGLLPAAYLAPRPGRQSRAFRALATRVRRKHGTATARVAVARHLVWVIYCPLKRQEPFRCAAAAGGRGPRPARGVMLQRLR